MNVDAVEEAAYPRVGSADLESVMAFFVVGARHFIQRKRDGPFRTEAHEDNVGGESVQPGGKGSFAAKGVNLAENLQKGFLSQIFSLDGVPSHAKTECVHAAAG